MECQYESLMPFDRGGSGFLLLSGSGKIVKIQQIFTDTDRAKCEEASRMHATAQRALSEFVPRIEHCGYTETLPQEIERALNSNLQTGSNKFPKEGRYYTETMDLLRGPNLRELCQNLTSPAEILDIVFQMAYILSVLETNFGMQHRDIKLQNFVSERSPNISKITVGLPDERSLGLITKNRIYLIDFGLATLDSGSLLHSTSLNYAPPEVFLFVGHKSGHWSSPEFAADVWGFGVCMLNLAVCTFANTLGVHNSIWPMGNVIESTSSPWHMLWCFDYDKHRTPSFSKAKRALYEKFRSKTENSPFQRASLDVLYTLVSVYLFQKYSLGNVWDDALLLDVGRTSPIVSMYSWLSSKPEITDELDSIMVTGQRKCGFFGTIIRNRILSVYGESGLSLLKDCLSWSPEIRVQTAALSRIIGNHPLFDRFRPADWTARMEAIQNSFISYTQ